MTNKIFIVQPFLTKYRIPVFKEIADEYPTLLVASKSPSFGEFSTKELSCISFKETKEKSFLKGKLFWQQGVIREFLRFRPNIVFLSANPRYISLWVVLFFAKILKIKVLLHGQGLYNKPIHSNLHKLMFMVLYFSCSKYVCYTQSSKDSLSKNLIYKKCIVAENSIVNNFSVAKTTTNENGILFIGRLRDESNLTLLIEAVEKLRVIGVEICLYIIGGGEELEHLKNQFAERNNIKFLGEIYCAEEISKISKKCFAGCYPGNAGLSILHFMSLSLPPIAHSSLTMHMGPEPSYIEEGLNGIFFEKGNLDSLISSIRKLYRNKTLCTKLQKGAFNTYEKLTKPTLGKRLLTIIKDIVETKE